MCKVAKEAFRTTVTRRHLCFFYPITPEHKKLDKPKVKARGGLLIHYIWEFNHHLKTHKFSVLIFLGIWGYFGSFVNCLTPFLTLFQSQARLARFEGIWADFFGRKSEVECDLGETGPLRQSHNSHVSAGRRQRKALIIFLLLS